MATVTKPLALNESLNTTEQNPRNVADVLSDGLENIKQAIEGGGSGGHTIQNSAGTDLPQEDKMQFADSFVSDDSTNGRTVVENIKEVSPADYASTTDEGIIVTDDGNDALIGAVSDDYVEVTADGEKTYGTLLSELYALVDIDKLSVNSYIKASNSNAIYRYSTANSSKAALTFTILAGDSLKYIAYIYRVASASSNCAYVGYNTTTSGTTKTDETSDSPLSGVKITLYYGNKKATVDLQTTANRCLYDSNTTVKQKIDAIDEKILLDYIKTLNCYTDMNGNFIITMRKNDTDYVQMYFDRSSIIFRKSTDAGNTWTNIKTFS